MTDTEILFDSEPTITRHPAPGLIGCAVRRREFIAAFKARAHGRALTPALMAARALLLGRPVERGFTPISNPVKLANGRRPFDSLETALALLARPHGVRAVTAGFAMLHADELERLREAALAARPTPAAAPVRG